MPALTKPPAAFSRFVPHTASGASAGAGTLFQHETPPPNSSQLLSRPERSRGEEPAQTLPTENPDRVAHDARNVLSGLMLFCELLAAPGVLPIQHSHYARDLETIVQSAVQIVERLAAAQTQRYLPPSSALPLPIVLVCDLASDLRHLQPLLASIAGPTIQLSVAALPCAGRIALSIEDLTRILINLVRNAADAMPSGGHVRIAAQYGDARTVAVTVTDDGPGIPEPLREQIFDLGFTTRHNREKGAWPAPRRRGLGLSIVRNLVEVAGGTVHVSSQPTSGARFEIILPIAETITSGTCAMPPNNAFATDEQTTGCIECH